MSSAPDGQSASLRAPESRFLYLHVIVVSLIGSVAILVWFLAYAVLNRFIWDNSLVAGNRWLFPVICLPFSLLVGLLVKYEGAEQCRGRLARRQPHRGRQPHRLGRDLPVTVAQSLASLFSGAVLGPEGAVGQPGRQAVRDVLRFRQGSGGAAGEAVLRRRLVQL